MLGEVENSSFIALLAKGGHSGLMPSNRVILPEEGSEEFYSNVFKKSMISSRTFFWWVGSELSGS